MRLSRRESRVPLAATPHQRAVAYDLTWRYPDRALIERLEVPGPAICSRCHAYLETDHWLYDEHRFHEIEQRPDVHVMLCPGCLRVERRLYEGEVTIRHHWNSAEKHEMLNLIHHEEARARATNPSARIALMEDRDGELYLLTTTQFLAERIGKELRKARQGALTVTPLPRERFSRVCWVQD